MKLLQLLICTIPITLSLPSPKPDPQSGAISAIGEVIKGIGSVASQSGGFASGLGHLFGDIGSRVSGKAANVLGKMSSVFGEIGKDVQLGSGIANSIGGVFSSAAGKAGNLLNLETKTAAPVLFRSIGESAEKLIAHPLASMAVRSSAATGEGILERTGDIIKLLESRSKAAASAGRASLL